MKARTRIAPSPTGEDLHIGNAYTALINYVVAKQTGGEFIVRIEDTDQTRKVEGSEDRILASLDWLGLTPDESPGLGGPHAPYRQSERLDTYLKYAEQLIGKGHAYYCFCTSEQLAAMRQKQQEAKKPPMYDGTCAGLKPDEAKKRVADGEPHVIRLRVPDDGKTVVSDLIRGEIEFENALIDDQVLIKSDGYPTYHMGVVVDDHLMQITHIIRGEEWISSTPKHVLLYRFLGWNQPVYAHMPLLRNPDKSKLSKRKNPVWVSDYRKKGFLPEAILNYLGTLAWAPPEGTDVFSLDDMIRTFDLKNIQTTAPTFDVNKLRWMNGEYIRSISISKIKHHISTFFDNKYPEDTVETILPLVVERIKTFEEFESLAGFFFNRPTEFEESLDTETVTAIRDTLRETDWNHDAMENAVRTVADKLGQKPRPVFMQLRLAITGKTVGPPLLESMEVLGKEESLQRLAV